MRLSCVALIISSFSVLACCYLSVCPPIRYEGLGCSHTHTLVHFLLCVCACIRARSYITRRWLAAFGYDVQIRTVRDYIIVWRGAGFFFLFFFLQNFPHGRAELAAACEAAQRESSSSICLSTFFFNLAFFLQTLPGLT